MSDNIPVYFPKDTFSSRYGNNYFTFDIENIRIIDQGCCHERYAIYEIKVSNGNISWIIKRRFREFYELGYYYYRSNILKIQLPVKSYFNSIYDDSFLESRKESLSNFLDDLLKQVSVSAIGKNIDKFKIIKFLELDKNDSRIV